MSERPDVERGLSPLDDEDIDWGEVNIFMDEELEALAREGRDYHEEEDWDE